ncbi:MAG: TlpA family protein disulfide reductase [Nitrospiraceae bacterium]|nr:TlpA family protein disulfide reductase [Nitrospiraceae bacterium]
MKRSLIILGLFIASIWSADNLLAAGFFKVGESAPAFTLASMTGESVALDNLKGKVIVLGLFHICDPCMVQGTNLQKVHEAMAGKNVAVIGVNSSGNPKRDVGEFLSAFPVKVTYPYLLDPSKTTDKLYGGGKFIPNVYVIDQKGVIRWQRVGNMELAGADVIIQEVEKLLAVSGM